MSPASNSSKRTTYVVAENRTHGLSFVGHNRVFLVLCVFGTHAEASNGTAAAAAAAAAATASAASVAAAAQQQQQVQQQGRPKDMYEYTTRHQAG